MKKKSLSAKKKKHRDLLNHLKDQKINKTYKKFKLNLNNLDLKRNFCVAVSGGPDSLALTYLIHCYTVGKKINIYNYIVDHSLRNNSSDEAKLVNRNLKTIGFNSKVLKWKGKKPLSNIQSTARSIRYSLIFKQCKKDKVSSIFTAHHQDDLYENFFIRIFRGSGLNGISSFNSTVFKNYNNINIIRPLLNIDKGELIYISKKVFNFYIKDPSNKERIFKRVRLRKLISESKKEGLDFNKLKLTINNLRDSNSAINYYVEKNILSNAKLIKKDNVYLLSNKFFINPNEVIFRSISILLKKIGGKYYNPRGKSVTRLLSSIQGKKLTKLTLAGCIIEKFNNSLLISKENTKKRQI